MFWERMATASHFSNLKALLPGFLLLELYYIYYTILYILYYTILYCAILYYTLLYYIMYGSEGSSFHFDPWGAVFEAEKLNPELNAAQHQSLVNCFPKALTKTIL